MDNSVLDFLETYTVYILIGMVAVIIILFILLIVNLVKTSSIRKKYDLFMKGENAKSLEKTILKRLDQVEKLQESDKVNREDIKKLFAQQTFAIQKCGMVKYDAFDEMGGKLSFSLVLLDQENTGIVINAVHTREGCYTYIKEIIKGDSVLVLTEEEKKAIDIALKRE